MHKSSVDKMQSFKDKYLHDRQSEKLNILDLGSQNIGGSYRHIFDMPNWNYFGVDLESGENVDIILRNSYQWDEIQSDSVDVLISGQTLEHIEFFWITILEISRVLKVGGMCCLIAPSSGYEHRYPVDCWRFYPDGMRALAKFAQLEALEVMTQWQDEEYSDGSNVWHDSVLIARKNYQNAESTPNFDAFKKRYSEILSEKGLADLCRLQVISIRSELNSNIDDLLKLETQYKNLQIQYENMMETIEKSFFWKLRNQWFKLKKIFYRN